MYIQNIIILFTIVGTFRKCFNGIKYSYTFRYTIKVQHKCERLKDNV